MTVTTMKYWVIACRGCSQKYHAPFDGPPLRLENPAANLGDHVDLLWQHGWSYHDGALYCRNCRPNPSEDDATTDMVCRAMTPLTTKIVRCDGHDCDQIARQWTRYSGAWPLMIKSTLTSRYLVKLQEIGWDTTNGVKCQRCRPRTNDTKWCGHVVTSTCPECMDCRDCDIDGYCYCRVSPLDRPIVPENQPAMC